MRFLGFFLCTLLINFAYTLPTSHNVDLKPNTPENIERLNNLGPDDNAELYGGQFQGDIVIPLEDDRNSRTGLRDTRYRWTNNVVPYLINEAHFDSAQIHYIESGIQRLRDETCLSFVPYNPTQHSNYVWVTGEASGCWSYVGMLGGRQQLNLAPSNPGSGCLRLYTIVHEFIHAIGFYHMQSASERDNYVRIAWENIEAGKEHNFNKYETTFVDNFGVEYDYGSVMHYPATAFSINGNPTIEPLNPLGEGVVMGQRSQMSTKDIERIRRMYCP